jgi:hypothetical protein
MLSSGHEGVVELIKHGPDAAPKFLRDQLGVELPAYDEVRLEPADLNDLTPTEYRADAVVTLRNASGDAPVLGIVVEVQLTWQTEKRWSWPVYVATLRARLRCPAVLLVICPDAAEARKCARPIELGHPGLVLCPLVLGPDRVPVVTDPAQVRETPELAVLSAAAKATHSDHMKILHTLAVGLEAADREKAVRYAEIVLAVLPAAARSYWEELMTAQTFEFQSDYARRLKAEGEARGEAKALLAVLDGRGFEVPEDIRSRIMACSEPEQLLTWAHRAAAVRTLDELFE